MKKSYCKTCKKTFGNGEKYCDICGNELQPKKVFTRKNIVILGIIIFLFISSIIAFCIVNSIVNKDKIKFPGELNSEKQSMLSDKEERIVNNFVKDIIDSYNAGDESNNYYKYLVYESNCDEFIQMVDNYEYYAEDREELFLAVSLYNIAIYAIEIESAAGTGTIGGVDATPEEIKIYIKEKINTILNDFYY